MSLFRVSREAMKRLTGLTDEELAKRGVPNQPDYDGAKAARLLGQITFRTDTRREEVATIAFALDRINHDATRFRVTREQMETAIEHGLIPVQSGPDGHRLMPRDAYRFWRDEIRNQTSLGGAFIIMTHSVESPAKPVVTQRTPPVKVPPDPPTKVGATSSIT